MTSLSEEQILQVREEAAKAAREATRQPSNQPKVRIVFEFDHPQAAGFMTDFTGDGTRPNPSEAQLLIVGKECLAIAERLQAARHQQHLKITQ